MSRDITLDDYNYTVGPLFMKALTTGGITPANRFAFSLHDSARISHVDFGWSNGNYNSNIMGGDESNIVWLNLEDDFYWSHGC
jgi:hypothetical protein